MEDMFLLEGTPKEGKSQEKQRKVKLMLLGITYYCWMNVNVVEAKTINEEAQLHAKVDGKKIIVTESSVKRDLRLADEEDKAVHKELDDRLGRIDAIDADKEITLVSVQDEVVSNDADKEMFDVDVLGEITLAQAPKALKTSKPKVKGIVFQELGKSTTTTTIYSQQSQDKGKKIMIEEPMKPKKKDQIRLDEETTKKLQAKFDEEERLAKIDDDHQLDERMQAQEQEELSIEEKATLLQQLLEKRRQHFVAKRAEEKRNKPPTKAQ
nr:hypothetical protein [Tanacetum cinerariifolium]